MKNELPSGLTRVTLTVLRILIGWHFLYEGTTKLAMDNWSSFSYLMESKWLLSGFFHWIASNPSLLAAIDLINIWGLILIGLALMLGIFSRIASLSGIILLLLYYTANPPFIETSFPVTGSDFFINLNLIEAGILFILLVVRRDYLWGLDRLVRVLRDRRERIFPERENQAKSGDARYMRRELIKNLASLPVLGIAFFSAGRKNGWFGFEENSLEKVDAMSSATIMNAGRIDLSELDGEVPKGRIGAAEISRIIPGGNLVAGFAHARDLIYVSRMIKNYFSDEKVIECLWLYEACGMNTTVMRTDEQTIRIFDKYRKRGGKIQWLAQTYPDGRDLTNIKMAVDNGAMGAFVMGGIADRMVYENRLGDLAHAMDFIRSQGLISGTAGHALQVPMAVIENNIKTDFFMKTFHHDDYWSAHPRKNRQEFMHDLQSSPDRDMYHDNLWCASAGEVRDFFSNCDIPWIAYKVLAAGSIAPEDGFKYAFESGADFVCAGMFDFQIIENANIAYNTLQGGVQRDRGWFG